MTTAAGAAAGIAAAMAGATVVSAVVLVLGLVLTLVAHLDRGGGEGAVGLHAALDLDLHAGLQVAQPTDVLERCCIRDRDRDGRAIILLHREPDIAYGVN